MENLYTPNCIRLNSGKYFNVADPKPEMICIEDVAHSLSQVPRFGGHLPEFYSVAQHSLLCSYFANEEDKFDVLMHDSSESILLDMPSPIKSMLPDYKALEHKLMLFLSDKFGFKYPFNPSIKIIDKMALELEWKHIMLKEPDENGRQFHCYDQDLAKKLFLQRYYELRPAK